MKINRWKRFKLWLYEVDILFWLPLLSAVIVNTLFLRHFEFDGWEAVIESICMGFIFARIFDDKK